MAKTKKVIEKKAIEKTVPTFVGMGSVSGEYIFEQIPGSVSARSYEEAVEKAKAIITSRPDLNF